MENALRYHIEVDLSQKHTSHAQLVSLTGHNKTVLEVGPATGYVTKVLQQRGCRVWRIENDAEAAKVAGEFCERMVVANVETNDFRSTYPDELARRALGTGRTKTGPRRASSMDWIGRKQ